MDGNGVSDSATAEAELKTSDTPENPPFVKENVDAELLETLTKDLGFPLLRAEKALYYTNNIGVSEALSWLEKQSENEHLDSPVRKPKLTPEEAAAKAAELQKRLREERQKKEKEEEHLREKRRIEQSKQLQEAQRQLEEAERKRQLEAIERERAAHKLERERQRELLRREWHERFGPDVPYPDEQGATTTAPAGTLRSKKEEIIMHVNQLKKLKGSADDAALLTCLKTLKSYCKNAVDNPTVVKYHQIRQSNAAFQSRIVPFADAVSLLNAVGFAPDGEFLRCPTPPDGFLLTQAIKFLDLLIELF